MELTWIAIAASLLMGGGALLIFIWSVRSHQFKSFEDVKYQVFWSDSGEDPPTAKSPKKAKEQQHGSSTQDK
jgi:cbb3-type cytochrome oxidase maturation protein